MHVKDSDGKAKFDILPECLVLVENKGIKIKNIMAAEMVLEENKKLTIEKWNEYFGKSMSDGINRIWFANELKSICV